MSNKIIKEDILDTDFVDQRELISDGFDPYLTLPLTSISAGGVFTINISSLLIGIISEPDVSAEVSDRLYVYGTSPGTADGYYTIDDLLTESTLTVIEVSTESTGGSVHFLHQTGASRVGFNAEGLLNVSADNVQDAIVEVDAAITSGGLTSNAHRILRQLIHLADGVGGPFEGFTSGAYREILPVEDPFPTSITWWESSSKSKKIVDKTITRNSNKTPSTIVWKAYDTDGSTVLAIVSDTIAYSGIFELNRTRTIS